MKPRLHHGQSVGARHLPISFRGDVQESVAQGNAQGIVTRLQLPRDIEGDVLGRLRIVGPSGRQELITHLASIQPGIEMSESGDVQHRATYTPPHFELTSQERQRIPPRAQPLRAIAMEMRGDAPAIWQKVPGYPLGTLPIFGTKESRMPLPCRAPGRGMSVRIPDAHPPPVAFSGSQRLTGIGHLHRLAAFHFFGIPGGSDAFHDRNDVFGNDDLIVALGDVFLISEDLPGQSGGGFVHTERVDAVIAAERGDGECLGVEGWGSEGEERGEEEEFHLKSVVLFE